MTQKEAKFEALRCSVAWLNAMQIDYEEDYTPKELAKIEKEQKKIVDSLYKKAEKIGGPFNQYLGF